MSIGTFSYAICPLEHTASKRPSYIMINSTGSYAFSYESGSATLGHATHNYITGSVVTREVINSSAMTPFRLDISPVAWRQTDAAGTVGDITFVYVRVR